MEALTAITPNLELPPAELERLYVDMVRIRRFEERVVELFQAGLVKGTAHSYAGEEAIAVGACAHLRKDDYVASYHRGHGHCIAKGARTNRMMAELMGRATGYCQGLGGSMHVADLERNILGANGIVGAAMPLSVGAGLAIRLRGGDQVVIAFFGDGANNQGIFHESLNLATVWRLPVLFVCENNQYALSTSYKHTTAVDSVATRAAAYGIPGVRIDGNDVLAVHDAIGLAVRRARNGLGPSLIEALTWRWGQHSMRANLPDPRSADDMAAWIARDPIQQFGELLSAREVFTGAELAARDAAAREEIDDAVAFAEASPEPEPAVLAAAVYAPHAAHVEPTDRGTRELTFAQALNEAMAQEMERDSSVFLMGEDVADTGGIFQVSKGLLERFGRERVRDTPISEATFCGAGVGAAIAGMRPIVEVQIFDFVTLMMDMLVNQAAKFRYMLGGRPTVPLVVRGPQGGGIRLAAQHSQSLEAWFAHVPGLVVVAPASAYDAKGLLIAAIRDDNPVIFLEHKLLYLGQAEPVPEAPYAIPLGQAAIRRPGKDVTIVATQMMVSQALQAATRLEAEGLSAEVIDPRTLRPLDLETIVASVKRTSRLVVVHEGWKFGGFGGEIAASVTEAAFDWLDAPVVRVGALDVPMPFNDRLERTVIPSAERIVAAVKGLYGPAAA
jgi:2-oxoisovalerate dehydrogenase E1 component